MSNEPSVPLSLIEVVSLSYTCIRVADPFVRYVITLNLSDGFIALHVRSPVCEINRKYGRNAATCCVIWLSSCFFVIRGSVVIVADFCATVTHTPGCIFCLFYVHVVQFSFLLCDSGTVAVQILLYFVS